MVKPYIFILYIECKQPYISLPSVIRFHKMKYIEDCYLWIRAILLILKDVRKITIKTYDNGYQK